MNSQRIAGGKAVLPMLASRSSGLIMGSVSMTRVSIFLAALIASALTLIAPASPARAAVGDQEDLLASCTGSVTTVVSPSWS